MTKNVVCVRIDLMIVQPLVRGRIEVPTSACLESLHLIIQAAMGWENCHLHDFMIGGRSYAHLDPMFGVGDMDDSLDSRQVDLADSIGQGTKRFVYTCNFGDDWRHEINLGRVREAKKYERFPALIDASGRCPPEDCGGPWRYAERIEALCDSTHEEHAEMREWCGRFDPNDADEQGIGAELGRIRMFPKEAPTH